MTWMTMTVAVRVREIVSRRRLLAERMPPAEGA